jgi:photosystem I P700 chlorophyll a apoprotein A2
MATKFPKFSQSLAQDPATRRIWYGIATAHDLEAHDSMTEETLYQKIFASAHTSMKDAAKCER